MEFLSTVFNIFKDNHSLLLRGVLVTLLVSLSGTIIGLVLGFILQYLRDTKIERNDSKLIIILKKILKFITSAYIEIVRGTPMIAQAVFIYYTLYKYLNWTPITAGIVIVSLNTAAYMAEIIRSGIQAVDNGQFEAGLSIGMKESQIFKHVVLPQAIKNSFPSIGNEFVVNIKDTSVLNAIALTELFFQGMSVAGTTYMFSESMFIIGVIYFILTFTVTLILRKIERRYNMKETVITTQSVPNL